MRPNPVAVALQVLGFAAMTVGAALIYPPAGWIVGGISSLVVGVTVEAEDAAAEGAPK